MPSERDRKPILYYQQIRKRDPRRPRSRRPYPYRQNQLTNSSIPDDDDNDYDESKSYMDISGRVENHFYLSISACLSMALQPLWTFAAFSVS
jgi:hypothetical protein